MSTAFHSIYVMWEYQWEAFSLSNDILDLYYLLPQTTSHWLKFMKFLCICIPFRINLIRLCFYGDSWYIALYTYNDSFDVNISMPLYVVSLKWHIYNESSHLNVFVTEVRHIVSVKIHVIRLLNVIVHNDSFMWGLNLARHCIFTTNYGQILYHTFFSNLHNGFTDKL